MIRNLLYSLFLTVSTFAGVSLARKTGSGQVKRIVSAVFLTAVFGAFLVLTYRYCGNRLSSLFSSRTCDYAERIWFLMASAAIFSYGKPRRRGYFPVTALFLLSVLPLSLLLSGYGPAAESWRQILFHSVRCIFVLLFLAASLSGSRTDILMTWIITLVSAGLSENLFGLLLNISGQHELAVTVSPGTLAGYEWLAVWGFRFLILAVLGRFFNRRIPGGDEGISPSRVAFFSVAVFLLCGPLYGLNLYNMAQTPLPRHAAVNRALYACLYLFILFERTNLFRKNELLRDLSVTREILHREQAHYLEVRENIDYINMKCHDLRKNLDLLQDRLSEEEVRKLKEAISIYDSSVHTGSDIFDTVICQKKIYCEKHGISFTALADGKAFGFMTASHLYALLLNALDNAIEAVDRLSGPEQKVVLLSARRDRDHVVLEVANYYSGVFDPDQPDTVKADRNRHGYGLKSMRYIVKQYHGTLTLETEDDMFTLTAVIPVPVAPPA